MKRIAKVWNYIAGNIETLPFLMRNCNGKWCLWIFNIDPNKPTWERAFPTKEMNNR